MYIMTNNENVCGFSILPCLGYMTVFIIINILSKLYSNLLSILNVIKHCKYSIKSKFANVYNDHITNLIVFRQHQYLKSLLHQKLLHSVLE